MDPKQYTFELGGKTLTVEQGRLAAQAHGAVTMRYGDTVVLATAVISDKERDKVDYFPLLVDYDEKLYAAGKIKGSRFIKREGRPSDEAILTNRLVDRSIRPLFNERMRRDVQVYLSTLSFDQENDPDIALLNAASLALALSPIPWDGPIAGVRVGRVKGEWVLNPTYKAREESELDLVIAGTDEKIVMIEAGANEASEEVMSDAIEFGWKHLRELLRFMREVADAHGLTKRNDWIPKVSAEDEANLAVLKEKAKKLLEGKLEKLLTLSSKAERAAEETRLKQMLDDAFKDDNEVTKEDRAEVENVFHALWTEAVTARVFHDAKRVDGRAFGEIRPLSIEVGLLPRTHGSALFTRGETQALSVVTLGSPSSEQTLDTMEESGKKRYMHHYNFPGFSVGEVSPLRGVSRREIGHGALAEKAILPVLPKDKEKFPYTIRVVSDIMSSNGSSSMASTCGSSLSLMDAGVPITAPVAGIAMGIWTTPDESQYKILTDLQGIEDHDGGMDFKVAGTVKGITAIQLDVKISGLTMPMIQETFTQARKGRLEILEKMNSIIAAPRPEMSPYAPRIYPLQINPDKIRDVIGPGGKVINEIIAKTGVQIDIEDSGLIMVTALSKESAEKALDWIKNLTREVQVGEVFQGKVTRILDFGAFVEVLPKQEGLVHISQLAPYRVNQVTDIVNIGDVIPVKVIEIDEMGRINLSLKDTDFNFPPPPAGGFMAPSDNGSRHLNRGGRPGAHGRDRGNFDRHR
ncbi:polyribonucleotide nucleotidyltransferase [Candidatus Uhrbacteria bacterium RIFCSPLOWO2_02_FULL_49_11]|uniref:Polyribonucleotide nucleotidyltransferase n=1 Tax=Candidatus Uhrbacteria bacterium RIFCSPLOWO2_02_FULL_49_11 TaxID=1802409 RepID=A0A1F7VB24_9BACT|nr:MAG: polyribonucleotide nucleotidyltransferase [Candidatus Uhrbacteria bacterium RIFCSPLOWO2_02_FULL_49_11]